MWYQLVVRAAGPCGSDTMDTDRADEHEAPHSMDGRRLHKRLGGDDIRAPVLIAPAPRGFTRPVHSRRKVHDGVRTSEGFIKPSPILEVAKNGNYSSDQPRPVSARTDETAHRPAARAEMRAKMAAKKSGRARDEYDRHSVRVSTRAATRASRRLRSK
jgi:hypothetical protein